MERILIFLLALTFLITYSASQEDTAPGIDPVPVEPIPANPNLNEDPSPIPE